MSRQMRTPPRPPSGNAQAILSAEPDFLDCVAGFHDDFARPNADSLGNDWEDMVDLLSSDFSPSFLIDEGVGLEAGAVPTRVMGYQRLQMLPVSGDVLEVVGVQAPTLGFASQVGMATHVAPNGVVDEGNEIIGLSSYYNILFNRYYIVAITPTARLVLNSAGNNLDQPATLKLRTDGERMEAYVDDVRTVHPIPVPQALRTHWRHGYYFPNAETGENIITDITFECSSDPIGTPPPVPSLISSTASENVGPTSTANWTGPPTMVAGDNLYVWVSFGGGGTIDNTLAPFGGVALGTQLTAADGTISRLFRITLNAGLLVLANAALTWTKTGGSASTAAVVAFVLRNVNTVIPGSVGTSAAIAAGTTIPASTETIDGPQRLLLWCVACQGTGGGANITEPTGFTVIRESGAGSGANINSMVAMAPTTIEVLGTQEIPAGSLSQSVASNRSVLHVHPNANLFT